MLRYGPANKEAAADTDVVSLRSRPRPRWIEVNIALMVED